MASGSWGLLNFLLLNEVLRILLHALFILRLPIFLFRKLFRRPDISVPKVYVVDHKPAGDCLGTLVFIHGFPDCPALWDTTVERMLAMGYRCLVVGLPGCDGEEVPVAPSPPQIVIAIKTALERYISREHPATMVGHDWGSMFALLLTHQYPAVFNRLVLVDVAKFSFASTSIPLIVRISLISYQLLFAECYIIGRWCDPLFKVLMRYINYKARDLSAVTVDMCHFYYGFWVYALRQGGVNIRYSESDRQMPTLFVYGSEKGGLAFHDDRWEQHVLETPKGKVVALPTNHWLMVSEQKTWCDTLADWITDTNTRE